MPGAQRSCGGLGACSPGIQFCTSGSDSWTQCLGEGQPSSEVCDGRDNDCNGVVDDAVTDAPSCPGTRGVCVGSVQQCVGGVYSGSCGLLDYGSDYEAIETRCDGLDNDCDGLVDATQPAVLMTRMNDFVLAAYDGGFALVALEELSGPGGYQVVLQRLSSGLAKQGAVLAVTPSVQLAPLDFAARANPAGTTFVAWTSGAVDAGVNLAGVDPAGLVVQLPGYPDSEKDGELSLGVSDSQLRVTWPAHFRWVTRLVTWNLVDGGVSAQDFGRFTDGGFNAQNEFNSSRLSPTGKVIGSRGYDSDAGNSIYFTQELSPGTRSSTAYFGDRYEFIEVGNSVQAGWSYSYSGFFPFFQPESGFQFKADALSSTPAGYLKLQNNQNITSGAIGRGQSSAVAVWTEQNKVAVVATPLANAGQSRQRILPWDAGFVGDVQVGHPGGSGQMVGVVWRDTQSGPGNIRGMMVCQP